MAYSMVSEPMYCYRCQSNVTWSRRWRPKTDERFRPIVEDGFLLLEEYHRSVCKCSGKCAYSPTDGMSPPRTKYHGGKYWHATEVQFRTTTAHATL